MAKTNKIQQQIIREREDKGKEQGEFLLNEIPKLFPFPDFVKWLANEDYPKRARRARVIRHFLASIPEFLLRTVGQFLHTATIALIRDYYNRWHWLRIKTLTILYLIFGVKIQFVNSKTTGLTTNIIIFKRGKVVKQFLTPLQQQIERKRELIHGSAKNAAMN